MFNIQPYTDSRLPEVQFPTEGLSKALYDSVKGQLPEWFNLRTIKLLDQLGFDFSMLEMHRFLNESPMFPSSSQVRNFFIHFSLIYGFNDRNRFATLLATKFQDEAGIVDLISLSMVFTSLYSDQAVQAIQKSIFEA